MNSIKNFFKNPKLTTILGLFGGIGLLVSRYIYDSMVEGFFDYKWILGNLFIIGIIIYFIIICMRLFANKGSVKIANIILISTLIIWDLLLFIYHNIISFVVFLIIIAYFVNILFKKKNPINHIVFLIDIVFYVVYNCYTVIQNSDFANQISYIIPQYLFYLLIIPYFFGYYLLLKEEK